MASSPYIFTFYSFKGGVGRSMALLNTAYVLSSWGKHVLIVDLDLEAPGVSAFLHRKDELAYPEGRPPLDILTLLGEVIRLAKRGVSAKQISERLPGLDDYLRQVSASKRSSLAPEFGTLGRLDILAADMDRDWCRRLADLGLQGMPQDQLLEISSALNYYLKNYRFRHEMKGLESEGATPTPYDYILIDSRTGITEIGGLCIGPLADRLVVICSLNDQNIEGTLAFLKEAGITPRARTKSAEPWDDADRIEDSGPRTLGPKPTLLVASPVPNGEIEFKRKRLNELKNKLGVSPLRLSYHPQMSLLETVFVRDFRDEYLAREYSELADALTRQVADHPSQLRSEILKSQTQKTDFAKAAENALRLVSHDPESSISLLIPLANGFVPKTERDFLVYRRLCATLETVPQFREIILFNWGNALALHGALKDGKASDELFSDAQSKYEAVLALKPKDTGVFYNLGNLFAEWAQKKQAPERVRLLDLAISNYRRAVQANRTEAKVNLAAALLDKGRLVHGQPELQMAEEAHALALQASREKRDSNVFRVWGRALERLASLQAGSESAQLYAEAGERYQDVVRLDPEDVHAMRAAGDSFFRSASLTAGGERTFFLSKAIQCFEEILRITPDDVSILERLAEALELKADIDSSVLDLAKNIYRRLVELSPNRWQSILGLARLIGKQASNSLDTVSGGYFEESASYFQKAELISNSDPAVQIAWGTMLIEWSKKSNEEIRQRLLETARAHLEKAEAVLPGAATRHLFLIETLRGDIAAAIKLLEFGRAEGKYRTQKDILDDPSFAAVIQSEAFQRVLSELPRSAGAPPAP